MSITLMPELVEERTVVRPYGFLALLQVLDVLTTGFILSVWSTRAEGNPIVAFLLDHIGLYPGLGMLMALKLAVVYMFYVCQTGVKFASSIYGLVIFNNILFIFLWLWN